MRSPILGSSYVARSVNAACNRMVNLFPEISEEGGNEAGFLSRAPGLRLLTTVGSGPIRGMCQFGGYSYIASGLGLYRVSSEWNVTLLGEIQGTGPVTMANNSVVLFVACGRAGYTFNSETGLFSQITDSNFPGADTVGYLDGYFIYNEPNTQRVRIVTSIANNGGIIDPLVFDSFDYTNAYASPDVVVGILIDHREVWVFGTSSTEVLYNSGDADFPLQPISGAFNEVGCVSPHSIVKLDNGIFWIGSDDRGNGIVYRANGYVAQRISTHAVEWQIQQYDDISDAIAYSYQQDGHSFYVLTFPSADVTWVFDIATSSWHERAGFSNGRFTRHRSNCQMNFNGLPVVGDFENGNIYALDMTTYADNGTPQKWLRSWRALPAGENDFNRKTHHSLQLHIESGVGLVNGQGSDPMVALRWSDDGGHTWSSEVWRSMGKVGEYFKRVIWRRLGMTLKLRDRIYEVSGTDPVKVIITGATLDLSNTDA